PGRPQRHPQRRRAGIEIVAIVSGLGAVELDLSGAGIEGRLVALFGESGPWRRVRESRQSRDRSPSEIGPRALRLVALDHDANRNLARRKSAHDTASR